MTLSPSNTPPLTLPQRDLSWHALPVAEVIAQLSTDPEQGLRAAGVQQRQQQFGPNELTAKPAKSAWIRFLEQFNQPLLYILLAAGLIKAILQSWVNAGVIWGVTVINAIIGYIQEAKAEEAIAALSAAVTTEATVIREGRNEVIPSRELVPGDVVLLNSGDKVPADLRLFRARNLQVDESGLTGESVPVEKSVDPLAEETGLADRINMAYAGSFVTFGQGSGLVVAIGQATETGRISGLLDQGGSLETPLTRKFEAFSRVLLYIILSLAAVTIAVAMLRGGEGSTLDQFRYSFEAAIALAVSAIPEGLPAVVTVTLAIGVSRMARRHAIIRKLPAVETLGSATVICSDKTGTLTENQMTVQGIMAGSQYFSVTGGGYSPKGEIQQDGNAITLDHHPTVAACLLAGLLCNDTQLKRGSDDEIEVVGDPTEAALLISGHKVGLDPAQQHQRYPRLDSIPFESDYQYMATLHQMESGRLVYIKGSTEALLSRCDQQLNATSHLEPLDRDAIAARVDSLARQGLRVLAFAQKSVPADLANLDHDDLAAGLVFLGLQGMIDPPRPEAIAAVRSCQSAGIQVKMITGDHVITARAIAEQMHLNAAGEVKAYTGQDLSRMDPTQLAAAVSQGTVFARVVPEQKLRLVEALQSKGHIVAMTGDGVNDAPALKQADVGIAMGKGGTEVAKSAADMLLTDDNFASIEAAVEEGRTVYRNLLKAIAFILPVNGGESMTILLSVLLGLELPITALQVLWLNMLNSITMTVPLAFEPQTGREMKRPPLPPDAPLLSPKLLQRILVISVFNWILIFGVFEFVNRSTGNIDLARTMAVQSLVMGRVIYLLSLSQAIPTLLGIRTGNSSTEFRERFQDILAIAIGIVSALVLQILFSQWGLLNLIFDTAPLTWAQWLICIALSVPMILVATIANRLDP
ncbi:MAG: HAD-IC family P-type ATPase [Synechococcaceae cyanobacterium SM2_3_2]|nr:HAD-IC family P-type ATPase [Synechococcaceae cyanobacterium SM2_3_2]